DRAVGPHKLHSHCFIVMAGNRKEDRALVNDMGSAMQSRLVHLHLRSDLESWREWAVSNGIDSRVIGFLSFMPTMLNAFDPDLVGSTFPCERTWEFVSKL